VNYDPPPGPPEILHIDAQLLIVDKPSGLLSVPGKPLEHRDCLQSRLVALYPEALLIHRLDLETSGIMVFARTKLAQRHLNWQFERRQISKTYVARVEGKIVSDSGEIDLPLTADWPNRPQQMVCKDRGKPAHTDWKVLERESDATRVELYPRTGRSHQLRVHMKSIGHPILGDPFYGDPSNADRLQLHAKSLDFMHPDGGHKVRFESRVPF
jgi:tRNA pseudouridine32 synthase / 23S rRNA pseudouridine746 synthase